MGDTNYFSGLVKVLETPRRKFFRNRIPIATFFVEIPQIRGNRIISVIFWGNLATEVGQYYQENDYVLIEGYLSIRRKREQLFQAKPSSKVRLTGLKIYPFDLKSNTTFTKV